MTALTSDRNTEYSLGDLLSVPVAAGTTIYAGSLVALDADGHAVPAADTAGLTLAGVAIARVDNSAGADGALNVIVRRRGRYRLASASALTQASLGSSVYAADDQTVALGADVVNNVAAGVIDKVEGAADCWVSIDAAALAGR
jgi:hypothetical protein